MAIEDLTGRVFGRWTVVGSASTPKGAKNRARRWRCRCRCGAEKPVIAAHLKQGRSLSCGCLQRDTVSGFEDLTGRSFGQWTVKRFLGHSKKGKLLWECQCSCGTVCSVRGDSLKRGVSYRCRSCVHRSVSLSVAASGPVFEARKTLKMSRKEFASYLGVSIKAVEQTEAGGRFFGNKGQGPYAQVKFNKRVPINLRQNRPMFRQIGTNKRNRERIIFDTCAYCGEVVSQLLRSRESGKAACCGPYCAGMYGRYGAKRPILTTNQLKPETVARFNPIARGSRKRNLWAGVEKKLKRGKQRRKVK